MNKKETDKSKFANQKDKGEETTLFSL